MPAEANTPSLEQGVARHAEELGVPELTAGDIALVLDLARDAAHGVARPAAPLTTYMVGYAAGAAAGSSLSELTARASRLAGA